MSQYLTTLNNSQYPLFFYFIFLSEEIGTACEVLLCLSEKLAALFQANIFLRFEFIFRTNVKP